MVRYKRDIEMCSWIAPDLAWSWKVFKLLITEGLDLDLDLGVLNVLNVLRPSQVQLCSLRV